MIMVPPDESRVEDTLQYNNRFYDDDLSNAPPKTLRLLGIYPGDFADPLVCKLQTVPSILSNSERKYTALSYSWSDQLGWKSITVNDQSDFKISKSLYSALRRLRLRDELHWVWSDQICINQGNIEEKNQQVGMMGDIYRQAAIVSV